MRIGSFPHRQRALPLLLVVLCSGFVRAQFADSSLKFDVATIKPSPPRTTGQVLRGCNGGPGTPDPGRFTCNNDSIYNLIIAAYQLKPYQFDAADWMPTALFEIAANVPAGATKEQMPSMIRNLLAERFKLAAHFEKKQTPIYEMTVAPGGPKFHEWVDEPPIPEAELPRNGPVRSVNERVPPGATSVDYQDMNGRHARKSKETMEGLAAYLSASSNLDRPVIDATGLKGTYMTMLEFVKERQYFPGREPAEPPPLADGPTLLKAVESQLGLKLEPTKGMIDVLVIDHIEKEPTAN